MCILPMPVAENKTISVKWNHEWKIKHKICKWLKVLDRNNKKQLPTEASTCYALSPEDKVTFSRMNE